MIFTDKDFIENLRRTFVFGCAQVTQMIVTIIRAKLIAIILGSVGMGINAIFQSTITSISTISSIGIFQSGIREISQIKDNPEKMQYTISAFNRITLILGFLGAIVCVFLSFFLSNFSFGNDNYRIAFIILSFAIPFMALSSGQSTILQATQSKKYIAYSSVLASLSSLIICIPLYIYMEVNGIALSIVLGYMISYLIMKYYVSRLQIKTIKLKVKDIYIICKPILVLGVFLMLGSFSITAFAYLTNICIGKIGSINDVGLYQGATSIVTQSIVVVLFILSSDFYPRLAGASTDNTLMKKLLNSQLEITILLLVPIIAILLLFNGYIINILLSSEFLVVIPIFNLMTLSLFFRILWIIMSYIILAKGDKKSYIIYDALLGNGLVFVLNVIFYYVWGFKALGFSYLISSVIVFFMLYSVVVYKYKITFVRKITIKLLSSLLIIITIYILSLIKQTNF